MKKYPQILFVLPAMVMLCLMMVFPFGYTAYLSLFDWFVAGGSPSFAGLKNYSALLSDARFISSVVNTLVYTIAAVIGEVMLGVALALLLEKPFKGRGLVRTAFLLPMVATPVAIALVWLLMFDPPSGIFNYLLSLLGIGPSAWVNNASLAIPALVLVDVWQWTPLVTLIVLGGLTALPAEPFEAALIDGATSWQSFVYITLPLLRPYIIIAALFRGIDALKTFDSIYVITRGGPGFASETLNLYIYSTAFDYMQMGYSSAMLVVFFAIILILSLMLIKIRRSA